MSYHLKSFFRATGSIRIRRVEKWTAQFYFLLCYFSCVCEISQDFRFFFLFYLVFFFICYALRSFFVLIRNKLAWEHAQVSNRESNYVFTTQWYTVYLSQYLYTYIILYITTKRVRKVIRDLNEIITICGNLILLILFNFRQLKRIEFFFQVIY